MGVHFAGDLRQALLDAAVATLDELGADRLSLREVARRAGVSHAAPAHHFTDKAGLLTAVAAEGFGMLVTYLADAQPGGARRHLRVWAAVRFAAGTFLAGFGALMLAYGFYGWTALLLVAATLLFSFGYLEMTVARSAPPPR